MKHILLIAFTTIVLSACSGTGGFLSANNNGAVGGLSQTFRW